MTGYLPPPPQISPLRTSFAFDQSSNGPSSSVTGDQGDSSEASDRTSDPPNTAPPAIYHSTLFSSSLTATNNLPTGHDNGYPQHGNSGTPPAGGLSEAVRKWDKSTLREWLETLKCGQYIKLFEENHITGDILLECDQRALKEMGIKKVGDRIRIDQALKTLRAKSINRDDSTLFSSKNRTKSLRELDRVAVSPFINSTVANSPEDSYFSSRARNAGGVAQPQRPAQPTKSVSVPNTASMPKTQTVVSQNRNSNPTVKNILSMDVVKQNTVKFIYGQGQSKTVNIQGCYSAEQIKLRALKKISVNDVSADSWTVHVADNELGTTTRQVSDAELVAICHSADRKERRRLILCVNGTTPSLKQLSKSQQILRDSLSSSGSNDSGTNESLLKANRMKTDDDDYDDDDEETQTVFPEMIPRTKGQLSRLSGQRPPSELISSNLAHFFPEVTPKEIEKTVRNSIRFSKRISRMSHFSRASRLSNRASIASSLAWGIPETEEDIPPVPDIPDELNNKPDVQQHVAEDETGTLTTTSSMSSSADNSIKQRPLSAFRNSLLSKNRQSKRFSQMSAKSEQSSDSNRVSISSPDTGSGADTSTMKTAEEERKPEDKEDPDEDESFADVDSPEESVDKEFLEAIEKEESGPSSWIKGRLIGSGSFGTVYLGMNSFTGELMAVKQVELPSDESESAQRKKSMVDALQREMDILRELQHENIVQYLGTNSEDNVLNIFLEYVPGGSVATLLANYGEFNESLIRNFVRQILQGLKYLHGQNIIHRDIKGANVLVDNKGCIKISDFGISKKIEAKLLTSNRVSLQGSVFWMAPEVVKQTSYTLKADIWSLGCLIIEMFSGTHPFPEFTQMQAIFRLGNSGAPTVPPDCTDDAKDFLQQTFAVDHTKRPTAEELLKHPFMKRMIV
ncbi:hypothetical protein TRICI_006433 [Trichomonascus ciferrii]|uniref:mitogen-activated protein kinase kinase kinase n=1 Tax=Trichomonascus ciferrii TaxID=44093 RepID=A0A642UH85_9ASCO|nr:hypothetical protein TRICI_006433 [Trichomonascus ciferrii]